MPFVALASFLVILFLIGGGARSDIQSLIILRPLAVLFCGFGLLTLGWRQVVAHRTVFVGLAACFALVLAHLIPLPPAVWHLLPGREVVMQIDQVAGLGSIWRPLSLVPTTTANALFSLFIPLAVAVLAAQLTQQQLQQTLTIILLIGLASGLLGAFQVMGPSHGPLYFYRITNEGQAVGLFSNRNHQAIFLAMLIPMLAVIGRTPPGASGRPSGRGLVMIGGTLILIPMILITGSRLGLVLAAMALVASLPIYDRSLLTSAARIVRLRVRTLVALLIGALIGAVLITWYVSRAVAVTRLAETSGDEEFRFKVWGPIMRMGWDYFPFGSGIGTFVETYRIGEPDDLLSRTYLNHAHNDWLEWFMTGGIAAVVLALAGTAAVLVFSVRVFRSPASTSQTIQQSRAGAIVALLLLVSSFGDYPLRTPSIAGLFALACIWLIRGVHYKNLGVQRGGGLGTRENDRSS